MSESLTQAPEPTKPLKASKPASVKSGSAKPRRKVKGGRKNISSILAVVTLVLIGSMGAGLWIWNSETVSKIIDRTKTEAIMITADMGLRVKEILVIGRNQTSQEQLLKAVGITRGGPILGFDLMAAKERVQKLAWVRGATVERLLPDTVLLRIEERKPLAIWQNQGKLTLIDFDGEIILRNGFEHFSDLLVVVGKEAPAKTEALLNALRTEPELMEQVEAAVWVGNRRWNLRMKGGIDVRLPENDAENAWKRLAEYEQAHHVLERDVQMLDLRQPDRLIVRKTPVNQGIQTVSDQET